MREAKPSPGVTNSQARAHIKVGRWLSLIRSLATYTKLLTSKRRTVLIALDPSVCWESQFGVFAFRASLRLAISYLRAVQRTDHAPGHASLLLLSSLSWNGQLSELIRLNLFQGLFN